MLITKRFVQDVSRSSVWSDLGKAANEGTLLIHLIDRKRILAAASYTLLPSIAETASAEAGNNPGPTGEGGAAVGNGGDVSTVRGEMAADAGGGTLNAPLMRG